MSATVVKNMLRKSKLKPKLIRKTIIYYLPLYPHVKVTIISK